jgi:hypothetical protein
VKPVLPQAAPKLLDAIYFPSTATGYWFGDPDTFSRYGMLIKVSEHRAMGFPAASLTEQGTVTAGVIDIIGNRI